MSEKTAATSAVERCPHCNGPVEVIGRGRYNVAIKRCRTCGREPNARAAVTVAAAETKAAPSAATISTTSRLGASCRVTGCPGRLRHDGSCPCCEKRAAWAEKHIPKRECEICGGGLDGSGNRRLCGACKPIKQRANVATFKAGAATKRD